jgi:hypothetical protein
VIIFAKLNKKQRAQTQSKVFFCKKNDKLQTENVQFGQQFRRAE